MSRIVKGQKKKNKKTYTETGLKMTAQLTSTVQNQAENGIFNPTFDSVLFTGLISKNSMFNPSFTCGREPSKFFNRVV